jgi:tetratricopeptide (TPR) repeat protein
VRYVPLVLLFIFASAYAEDSAITFLERKVQNDPDDFIAQNQLVSRYLDLLRVTGDDSYLAKARHAAEASVHAGPLEMNTAGLSGLARVQLASHEFALARDTAKKLRDFAPDKTSWLGILGDALLELGDYAEAASLFNQLAKAEPGSFDTEPRLARLAVVRGELDAARDHYERTLEAARGFTPRQPSLEAWCLVQRGQLYFSRGDWSNAGKDYAAALDATPDYWAGLEHMAELRAAQERYPDAVALYEKVNARVSRPELMQALGDLYLFINKQAEAKPWHDRAQAMYLKAADQGDVRYYHHLAGFYCDSVENSEEALKWARRDLQLRHSIFAHDSMAWALYRGGQFKEAAEEMKQVLAQGTRDSHLFFHAGMIATANGDLPQGKEFLKRAATVNSHYNAFHVHR